MKLTLLSSIAVVSIALGSLAIAETLTKGNPQKPFTPVLKNGDYVWVPKISPTGPVVIVVSLAEQKLYVYRNGVRIGRSTISSGKAGHLTPTGVFTILEKNVKHISSIYKGASMPYMERLTWSGVALHAGSLPGIPDAHGCVRMPLDFARQLYTVTSTGTTVIVTDQKATTATTGLGMVFASSSRKMATPGIIVWNPEKAPSGPVSVILSSADRAAYVYRNGIEIGRAPVDELPRLQGLYVYSALAKVDFDGRRDWFSTASFGGRPPNIKDVVKSGCVDPQFQYQVRALITTGTTLILTDRPVTVSSRSGAGFNILTTAATP